MKVTVVEVQLEFDMSSFATPSPKTKTKRRILVVDDEYADLNFISEEKGNTCFPKD